MKRLTTSLALAIALGTFTQISAEDIETQITKIEKSSSSERPALVKEFKSELKNMGEEQRIEAMHKIQEKMPELAKSIQGENISQKINEIKNADPTQRRELMNSFKKEISQMNEQERSAAVSQMRTQMKAMNEEQMQTMSKKEIKSMNQDKERIRAEKGQMDHVQGLKRTEQMNQQQGANQFNKPGTQGTQTQTKPQGFGQH